MSDRDLPTGTADDGALSFDEGVDAISNLLDPETDLDEEHEGTEEAEGEASPDDEPDAIDDEAEGEDEQIDDGPEDTYSGGKFAADDAKVTLDDGSTITIAELKRNNLFQRDYSRKTEELAHVRKDYEAKEASITEAATALNQQWELIQAYTQIFMPQPPPPEMMQSGHPKYDPLAYMEQRAAYEEHVARLQQIGQLRQQHDQQSQKKATEEAARRLETERNLMFAALPHLRDPKRWERFQSDAKDMLEKVYKIDPKHAAGIDDHRMMHIVHDALAYRKLLEKKPAAAAAVRETPKMKMVQKQRVSPQAVKNRDYQAKSAALKKTGDFDAGVAVLMNFVD